MASLKIHATIETMTTEDDLQAAVAECDLAIERAREARDARLRQAKAEGWRQVDIIKATGLSRETVRQALDPAIREAAKKAAQDRRASKKTT